MNLEISVVRLSNEDVITTSCENAISFTYVDGENSYGKFNKKFREGFNSDIEAFNSVEFQEAIAFISKNIGLITQLYDEAKQGHGYHILPNGTIEECENIAYHDNWWEP